MEHSINGLNPLIWGPTFWYFIHTICLLTDTKVGYSAIVDRILNSLKALIPCSTCRMFYTQSYIAPTNDYFKWSVDLHNRVNEKLCKKTISYDVALILVKSKLPPLLHVTISNILNYIAVVFQNQTKETNKDFCFYMLVKSCVELCMKVDPIYYQSLRPIGIGNYDNKSIATYIDQCWIKPFYTQYQIVEENANVLSYMCLGLDNV